MRRFIAYILASLTIFLGIGASFKPVATSINPDITYTYGREITFKVEKNDGSSISKEGTDIEAYSAIIKNRLDAYQITDYKIQTKGYDTISVTATVKNQNDKKYEYISNILSSNPIIEIATTDDKDEYSILDDNNYKWHDNSAYITYDGNTSIVVMPIPTAAKTKMGELIKYVKENIEKKKSNDEEKTPDSIVLWFNREQGQDKYSLKDKNENIKKKVIKVFNSTNFYYGSDEAAFQLRFTPSSTSASDVQNSYDEAVYYLNLFNSATTDYKVSQISSVPVSPTVEELISYGEHVTVRMSASFIALLIAFIAISIILALVYRLGAIAIISNASAFTFLSFLLFVLFKPVFNISAYVGIIILFIISMFIGIAYNSYVHEECYKGRSLKKANYEAGKKTTFLTFDLSVISLITGLLIYFIGGTSVASLGVMLIIGSVLNLFINTFLLKGLMWLITNSTYHQTHLAQLHIDASKVPNLSKEEKPTFTSPYEKKNYAKYGKVTGIIFGSLTLASLIGVIVFASIKGDFVNSNKYYSPTYELSYKIVKDYGDADPIPSLNTFKSEVIDNIKNGSETLKYNSEIDEYKYSYYLDDGTSGSSKEEPIHKTDFYYIIHVTEANPNSETYSFNGGANTSLDEAFRTGLSKQGYELPDADYAVLNKVEVYNLPSNSGLMVAASVTSLAICCIYFAVRYRHSRALTTFIIGGSSILITAGVMALTRINATPVMAVSTIITFYGCVLTALYFMHKDKDMIRDERIRDIDTRKNVLNKSFALSLIPATVFTSVTIMSSLLLMCITNKAFILLFVSSSLGLCSATIIYVTLFTTLSNYFDNRFMRIKLPEIKHKKKKKIVEKSNEPSEAIFIGIND